MFEANALPCFRYSGHRPRDPLPTITTSRYIYLSRSKPGVGCIWDLISMLYHRLDKPFQHYAPNWRCPESSIAPNAPD